MAGNCPVSDTAGGDAPPLLDLVFDSGALYILRAEVLALAGQSGLSDDRAGDVVLAVHELAADVVCQMQALSGPRGTRVTLIFELPAAE